MVEYTQMTLYTKTYICKRTGVIYWCSTKFTAPLFHKPRDVWVCARACVYPHKRLLKYLLCLLVRFCSFPATISNTLLRQIKLVCHYYWSPGELSTRLFACHSRDWPAVAECFEQRETLKSPRTYDRQYDRIRGWTVRLLRFQNFVTTQLETWAHR